MAASDGKAQITTTDPRALEREVELLRTRLAGTVDELHARVQPKAIASASAASARAKVSGFALNRDGSLRTGRVAAVGGGALAVTALLVVLAVRARR